MVDASIYNCDSVEPAGAITQTLFGAIKARHADHLPLLYPVDPVKRMAAGPAARRLYFYEHQGFVGRFHDEVQLAALALIIAHHERVSLRQQMRQGDFFAFPAFAARVRLCKFGSFRLSIGGGMKRARFQNYGFPGEVE